MPPTATQSPRPSLWRRLRHAWAAFMGRKPHPVVSAHAELVDTAPSPLEPTSQPSAHTQRRDVQPYNPQALPAAREQWQRGDWASLAALTLEDLQDHPDRAKLALLVSIGKLNVFQKNEALAYMVAAQSWGIEKRIIHRLIISSTYKTIAEAAKYAGHSELQKRSNIKADAIINIKNER